MAYALQRILDARPEVLVKGGDWPVDRIVGAAPAPDGGTYLVGEFRGSMQVGAGASMQTVFARPGASDAFIARLDPLDGGVDIVATDRLGVARAGHQATVLCDGTVLFSGGTADQTSYERYNPPSLGRR